MIPQIKRFRILDVWVDSVTMNQALEFVKWILKNGERPHSIFAVNPEKAFSIPKDPILYETFRNADLLIPDGIGVVLAARVLYHADVSRVTGVDLMASICRIAATESYTVFIYGSREEVNAKAARELVKRFPELRIAGRSHGYLKQEEMGDLINRINDSHASILFLALGSPKQERWYADNHKRLTHVKVCQGIGGTLDILAGNVRRAPGVWQRCSAEWLYRLLAQPKRFRRQKVYPAFIMNVLLARFLSSPSKKGRDLE